MMATIPQRQGDSGRKTARHYFATIYRQTALFAPHLRSFPALKYSYREVIRETHKGRVMKLVHTAAQARRFVAFNDLAGDFLKMLGVAVLSGLFFSLVAGLVVLIVASDAYANPPQVVSFKAAAAQTHPGGRLLLTRQNGQIHPANMIETDVYARVTQGKAVVRVTQTFAGGTTATKSGRFVFEAPADAAIVGLHIQTGASEREIVPSIASNRVEYLLDEVDAQEALSVVVEYEQPLAIVAHPRFRIPFTKGKGALNLMIDLETAAELVTASDPLATIERIGGTHVVSLTDRPVPRVFELRWAAPTRIAQSVRDE
jgi:hypothetical protein